MNVTLQTNNFNSQYYKNNNPYNNKQKSTGMFYNQTSFKGIEVPTQSKLLSPFHKAMDKLTDWIARNYTTKLYGSKLASFLAKKTDKLNGVVDHMQVMGSIIISGMYMSQTLRNQQLDEDRRRTLAINQGLTFLLSTIGSYVIDDALNSKWEKVTLKYAEKQTGDKTLGAQIAKLNKERLAKFDADKLSGILPKKAKFKATSVLEYISDHQPSTGLEARLRGMGVLKKLIIFGTVYRFLAPVAVTPFATWIGNKFVHKNAQKAAEAKKQSETTEKKS